jgi:hypothetical protein
VRAESVTFRPRMPIPVQMVATARPAVLVPMAGSFRRKTQVFQQIATEGRALPPFAKVSKRVLIKMQLLGSLSQTRSFGYLSLTG